MKSVMEQFTIHPRAKAPVGRSIGTRLNDVYGSYSKAKEEAYEYCCELCKSVDGEGFGIVDANCMKFSVMFRFKKKKKPDNGRMMIAHITRDHNHAYYLF